MRKKIGRRSGYSPFNLYLLVIPFIIAIYPAAYKILALLSGHAPAWHSYPFWMPAGLVVPRFLVFPFFFAFSGRKKTTPY
jgi:hypothetical protein